MCTGNVARSVMLAAMLESLSGANVRSRGTHAIPGSAVSARTLAALVSVDVAGGSPQRHRSAQLDARDLAWADVVLCVEASQVRFAQAVAPGAVAVSVGQLAAATGGLAERLISVGEPDASFDVPDPAGGDQAVYDECARTLWRYARQVAPLL